MKHSRLDKKTRREDFKKFLRANPPRMPTEFTHKEYKRVVNYARIAFYSAFFTGMNHHRKHYTDPQ